MFQKSQQSGRSMIEMLGVLAIIGILSVAGIAGYTQAIKKNTVNDILSAATTCAILTRSYKGGDIDVGKNCTDIGLEPEAIPSGVSITGKYDESQNIVTVTVTAQNEEQCLAVAAGAKGRRDNCATIGGYKTDIITNFND
ncbi:MAG: prepilin-type N-terminal cleavage/methylation domain-containing protein [Alphaproteobacteria bacterium]|nr:prepilin-type N-terminal cleavage/methylation domain-containing protein [Alphaproteobacteria bacterium]